jgi:cobalamin synthase
MSYTQRGLISLMVSITSFLILIVFLNFDKNWLFASFAFAISELISGQITGLLVHSYYKERPDGLRYFEASLFGVLFTTAVFFIIIPVLNLDNCKTCIIITALTCWTIIIITKKWFKKRIFDD